MTNDNTVETTTDSVPRRRRRASSLLPLGEQLEARELRHAARSWIRSQIEEFVKTRVKTGQNFTTADVLAFVDDQAGMDQESPEWEKRAAEAPRGYAGAHNLYPSRYNTIRTILESMHKDGLLVHTDTVNVRGITAVGYTLPVSEDTKPATPRRRRARATHDEQVTIVPPAKIQQQYSVIIDTDGSKDAIREYLESCVAAKPELFEQGFRGMLLSRK